MKNAKEYDINPKEKYGDFCNIIFLSLCKKVFANFANFRSQDKN